MGRGLYVVAGFRDGYDDTFWQIDASATGRTDDFAPK
jgi:hypothetical protein